MSTSTHASTSEWLIRGNQITQVFEENEVLAAVEIEVTSSEVVAIAGASGSGKSTLLHVLSGLRRPSAGTVWWRSDSVVNLWGLGEPELTLTRRHFCSFVFQFSAFLNDLNVRENVALPLILAGHKRGPALTQADACLTILGMDGLIYKSPSVLSGGEQQRVAIARALASQPRVIFADEPTGSLDKQNSETVMSALVQLAHEFKTAAVVVTHDRDVMERASRVVWLQNGLLSMADRPLDFGC